MLSLILRRVAIGFGTLWVVSILVFAGLEILPGDAADIRMGQNATAENLAAYRKEHGLDRPAPVRYLYWLGELSTGDLGISQAGGATISSLIGNRLWNTLALAAIITAIAVPLSVFLGLLAATFPGSWLDRILTFGSMGLNAIPEFLVATVLILVVSVRLGWFPAIAHPAEGMTTWQMLHALAMPILTLTIVIAAQMIRMTRAAVLNVMSSPYIEMAILKGVPRRRIIFRHALFNCIGPIVNVIALNLAYLVSGVVVVETIFAYPGLAKLMIDGVQTRDLPLVQACAMIFCGTYVMLILISDIVSIVSNPRLRHPK
ncbi:MAG: ABC transporter permease [Hyphomicrobiaceae bacterium]